MANQTNNKKKGFDWENLPKQTLFDCDLSTIKMSEKHKQELKEMEERNKRALKEDTTQYR